MAGYRQIHPKIWKDEWFIELEPPEKLFFIYLFSNDETTFSGLYKLPLRVMINETGLAKKCILEMLNKFSDAGKVYFENGLVWVVNMRRHHPSNSPKVTARINADMVLIPNCDLKRKCMQSLDMLSIPYPYATDTESLKDEDKIRKEEDNNSEALERPNIFLLYENNFGSIQGSLVDELKCAETLYPGEWIAEAFRIAAEHNARRWSYVKAILERWMAEGYKTDNRKPVHESIAGEEF
jgi:DnaD/phage-associated family protein